MTDDTFPDGDRVLVNSRFSRTSVFHSTACKYVDEFRKQDAGYGYRTDLTADQCRQWGLRECKRCKADRTGQKYTEVCVGD